MKTFDEVVLGYMGMAIPSEMIKQEVNKVNKYLEERDRYSGTENIQRELYKAAKEVMR